MDGGRRTESAPLRRARATHKPKVGGSNPPATKKIFSFNNFCKPRNHPNGQSYESRTLKPST